MFTTVDARRALVAIATSGAEGASPHVASDLATALCTRGRAVALKAVAPSSVSLVVDGHAVEVREAGGGEYEARRGAEAGGTEAVRVAAAYALPLPAGFATADTGCDVHVPLASQWAEQWPTAAEVAVADKSAAFAAYASRVVGVPCVAGAFAPVVYLSTAVLAEAVVTLLAVPRAS